MVSTSTRRHIEYHIPGIIAYTRSSQLSRTPSTGLCSVDYTLEKVKVRKNAPNFDARTKRDHGTCDVPVRLVTLVTYTSYIRRFFS